MIDLNLISVFLEVAKLGNLNLAAKKLSVTTPAISQRIKILEAQVGKSLFLRKRSGMELNSHGKKLLELCCRLNREIVQIDNWVMSEKGYIGGELAICTISTLISHVFPAFLEIFLKKYPNVSIILNEGISAIVEKEIMAGKVDLGVIVGRCKKPSLKTQRLFINNDILMVCSPGYFLAKKEFITKDDLRNAKVIWHAEKESRTAREICKKLDIIYHQGIGAVRLQSMDYCKYYALRGLGVAFIAKLAVYNELRSGKLVALPIFNMKRPIYLISRNEQYESPAVMAFRKEFVRHCHMFDKKWGD